MNCVCVLKACFKEINDTLENLRDLVKLIYQRHPFMLNRTQSSQETISDGQRHSKNIEYNLQSAASCYHSDSFQADHFFPVFSYSAVARRIIH